MNKIEAFERNMGKFVGVSTYDGRTFNAQPSGSSNKYVTFSNTRTQQNVKIAKANIKSVSFGGQVYDK